MRYPILTSFFGGALIFSGFSYVGYRSTAGLVYQHEQSTWFSSLGEQDARQLRITGGVLLGYSLSCLLMKNTEASLQRNVDGLAEIRGKAPQELWPVLDLRLARDYAAMAQVEGRANNSVAATNHRRHAADLLRSLGWNDVSDDAVAALGDKDLRRRMKR